MLCDRAVAEHGIPLLLCLMFVLFYQLINHVADLVPDVVLVIEHDGLALIKFSIRRVFLRIVLKLASKRQFLITLIMQVG